MTAEDDGGGVFKSTLTTEYWLVKFFKIFFIFLLTKCTMYTIIST